MKKTLGALSVACILSLLILAQSLPAAFSKDDSNELWLTSKGMISPTSHFPGTVVWSMIKGDQANFLVRGEDGLFSATAVLVQSDQCTQEDLDLCFEGTIQNLKNNDAFKQGDTFNLGINLLGKKQYFSFTSGFFENVDVSMNLQKIVIR